MHSGLESHPGQSDWNSYIPSWIMQIYAVTIMTESVGALAQRRGTGTHKQQDTDNSTETRAETPLCHTMCICYISVISTVLFPPQNDAFLSFCLHADTKTSNYDQKPSLVPTNLLPQRTEVILILSSSLSLTPLKLCSAFPTVASQKLSVFSRRLSVFPSHDALKTLHLFPPSFLFIDEIVWASCPRRGSRFSRLPLATTAAAQAGSLGSILRERSYSVSSSMIRVLSSRYWVTWAVSEGGGICGFLRV